MFENFERRRSLSNASYSS